jgi:hypothetical protein
MLSDEPELEVDIGAVHRGFEGRKRRVGPLGPPSHSRSPSPHRKASSHWGCSQAPGRYLPPMGQMVARAMAHRARSPLVLVSPPEQELGAKQQDEAGPSVIHGPASCAESRLALERLGPGDRSQDQQEDDRPGEGDEEARHVEARDVHPEQHAG